MLACHHGQGNVHTLHNLKVPSECFFEHWMPEQTPLGDLAHEKVHDNRQLVHGLVETRGSLRRRSPTNGLLQVCVRRRVVELNCLDTAEVVVVPRELRVTRGGRESGFGDELVGLVIQTVLDVAPQKTVDKRSLCLVVVP